MILYLNSHDAADAGQIYGRHQSQDVRHVTIPSATSSGRVVNAVLSGLSVGMATALDHTIDLLVINAHCSPGVIHLGGASDEAYEINERNAESFASPFARMLKPSSIGGQGVEITGSYVGAGSIDPRTGEVGDPDAGARFLYRLACSFGRRVLGGAGPQVRDSEELSDDSIVVALPDSDPDQQGPLSTISDPRISHPGGYFTRTDAFFDSLTLGDPRTSRRMSDKYLPLPR